MAMIGDSLSTGFHVSSPISMLLRARTCQNNWVVDDSGEIDSLFERLTEKVPVDLHHLAYVSAHVDAPGRRSLGDRLTGTFHMSHQIDLILKLNDCPEVVLLWIGHNNLDWASQEPTEKQYASLLEHVAFDVTSAYEMQLRRLLDAAVHGRQKMSVIVFALVSFEQFFSARQQAEEAKVREPHRYPYLEADYRYFCSMRPEYRKGMIEIANEINARLERVVARLQEEFAAGGNLRILFSTALHDAGINRAEMLCDVDAWHPSPLGHRALAEHVFPVVYRQIAQHRDLL
jgi:lysophospholipase L1-like esterase